MKTLWLEDAEHREKNGFTISELKLNANVEAKSVDEFVHEFRTESKDLTESELAIGHYLIVSIPKRPAIAAGRVIAIDKHQITLVLER